MSFLNEKGVEKSHSLPQEGVKKEQFYEKSNKKRSNFMKNQERIREIFTKLKKGHDLYKRGDDAYKERITKACDGLFNELEELGICRIFSESLLFWGKEFVDSVVENDDWWRVKKKDRICHCLNSQNCSLGRGLKL